MTLSSPVSSALPRVVALARRTVAAWRRKDVTNSALQVPS